MKKGFTGARECSAQPQCWAQGPTLQKRVASFSCSVRSLPATLKSITASPQSQRGVCLSEMLTVLQRYAHSASVVCTPTCHVVAPNGGNRSW